MESIITLDFETEAIERRPDYPPRPASVGINQGARYDLLSWGHPADNNCTWAEAYTHVRAAVRGSIVACHNAAFELAVLETFFDIKLEDLEDFHDTLFLLFLDDPRAKTLSLKPSCERLFGEPPDEQDALRDWILGNVPRATPKNWGAYIAQAPFSVVKPYLKGDVRKTKKLFNHLYPDIKRRGMLTAYNLEKKVLREVLLMEAHGVRIDERNLRKDCRHFEREVRKIDATLRRTLGDINYGSSKQLVQRIRERGLHSRDFLKTAGGADSASRASIQHALGSSPLGTNLTRRSNLVHMLDNFYTPWLDMLRSGTGGVARLYPSFNQVRGRDDRSRGTRTGRFSSTEPNFQQLNREPEDPTLPFMRRYVLAEPGHVLLGRDYSGQELRILAHYEEGVLYQAYKTDPHLDGHAEVGERVHEMANGATFDRSHIKGINFGKIYGMGVPKLAATVSLELEDARVLDAAWRAALPGVAVVQRDIKEKVRAGEPIRTWGGREYYVEPPDQYGSKEYKLLNTLIQGSAADHTKNALIRIGPVIRSYGGRLLLTVHDEFLASVPKEVKDDAMLAFKEEMEFAYFDIPTLSDGKWGPNWGAMTPCKL